MTFDRGAHGRLVEFEPPRLDVRAQAAVALHDLADAAARELRRRCSDGENGLVELLALSETTLISMERACLVTKDGQFTANTVRLFSVELVECRRSQATVAGLRQRRAAIVVGVDAAGKFRRDDVRANRQRDADVADGVGRQFSQDAEDGVSAVWNDRNRSRIRIGA